VDESAVVRIKRLEKYRFEADYGGPSQTRLVMDEPKPLGDEAGPNASKVLASAVGNCLSASLLFCLSKARLEVGSIEATAEPYVARNEEGYWRVKSISVKIVPVVKGDPELVKRCLAIFENYCVVTASLRKSIQVDVTVLPQFAPES
jgi:uncharacterized OsmC-like protein